MKMQEIRSLNAAQLVEKLKELRMEQINLKFQQASGQLEKPHRVSQVRRTIAKVKTVLTSMKNAGGKN